MSSKFLTPVLLNHCLNIIRPTIEAQYLTNIPGRTGACITVLDPLPGTCHEHPPLVLWRGVLGETDQSKWRYQYDVFSEAKARTAWKAKLDNHVVNSLAPQFLEDTDFKFGGGIYRNGICLGTSGLAKWEYDLVVSNMFVGMIEALLIEAASQKFGEKILFLGDSPYA